MDTEQVRKVVTDCLPSAEIVSIDGTRICLRTSATGDQLLAAERTLRFLCGGHWEVLCVPMSDKNALRMVEAS